MPRYIDLDKAIQDVESVGAYYDEQITVKELCLDELKGQPIADVVPRSEVDKWKERARRSREGLQAVLDEIPETKAEIITDIADLIWQGEDEKLNVQVGGCYFSKQEFIAELKKKYSAKDTNVLSNEVTENE